ncbi:hypothetical protein JK359_36575 [Streptomyces actinomycinicus]|uniref:Vanadium-dependent haloperoxidase n=1 Tax=Streptomyces actinomycinicus TaxID=1695166 RepID=A0A937ESK1_9ACTN|nr:hypothetical protein [Streptomyces actinomycinicus]MBL1087406.1 hypothetical protein [Streptomyces actinomycinicus]
MTTSGSSPAGFAFDFDNGNFYRDLIAAAGDSSGQQQAIGPQDVSLIVWVQAVMWAARFDALAPYHPTAVGVHSRIDRRPAEERATNRNKNIAALYASSYVANAVYPEREHVMRKMMTMLGLDPDDTAEDPTTPAGIGTIAGKAAVDAHTRDGMNFLGDEGRTYNGRPFEDYTGYRPVNTAYELTDPSRWQPALRPHRRRTGGGPGDKGAFLVQQFVTPQLRLTKPFTYEDPARFELARPEHSDHTDPLAYQRSVDEVLSASAGLTDEQKVTTEFFDNTYLSVLQSTKAAGLAHELDLDGWVQLLFTSSVAQLDALIAAWHHKHAYDAVRPFSAISHVYGSKQVTAWGGPGNGTVQDLPADQWTGYLPPGDTPEYPCGTTTLCAAEGQAARRFLGDDVLDWTHTVPAGSTLTEPGHTPEKDVELHYATWTDFAEECARSRVWAGVHFRTTTERSLHFGTQFGDRAYDFVQRHVNGDVQD